MAGRFTVETVFKAIDRVTAPVRKMQNGVHRLTRSMSRNFAKLNKAINKTAKGLKDATGTAIKWATVAVGGITGGVALLMREFSKVENAEAAFTPLLGGAERAKDMVAQLNETAASTPFQFETLAGSANQLLPVMNGNIEKTIQTVRMLGDTAGGNAQKLDSITRGFTKAMLKGKVDMESLNMIAEAGVPIFQDLADVMGVEVGEKFFKEISAGKVTTEQLTKAFEKLTSEGGKFYQGMEIASRTTSGLWSTLQDNISLTAAEIGGALAPVVKDLIKEATTMAQKAREWAIANRELIGQKFAKFVEEARKVIVQLGDAIAWIIEHREPLGKFLLTVGALVVILKTLAAVMAVVNLVMMANPIGLIVVAIGALVAAVAAMIIWWDELKAAFLSLPGPVQAVVAAVTGPIGWIIGAAALIEENWAPLSGFFANLWDGVVAHFERAMERVRPVIEFVKNAAGFLNEIHSQAFDKVAGFLGFGDGQESGAQSQGGQMVSPQERTARTIEEHRSQGIVTILDQTGRAEETRPLKGTGALLIPATGNF